MKFSHYKQILQLALVACALSFRAQAALPQIVSISPASGSGQTQTFTLTVSDSAGASDIGSINLLINNTFNSQTACWIFYDHVLGAGSLASDGAVWTGNSIAPGQGTAQNTQCTVQIVSAGDSGNTATLSLNITFSAAWLGPKTLWAASQDRAHAASGYQQVGTYTAVSNGPVQDYSVSMNPASQTTTPGQAVTYHVTLTSINGFSGHVTFGAITLNPPVPGVNITTSTGAPFSADLFVPAGGVNSAGTIKVATSTSTPPADIAITANFQVDFLQHSFQVGLTLVPPTVPVIALNPNTGSASTQTFTIAATDPGGYAAVSDINFLINSALDGRNACWLYFHQQSPLNGPLTMASDNAADWSRTTQVASSSITADPISNSQCSVFGGPTTLGGSGNTLTLTITLTFTTSFAGQKNVYVRAADVSGPDSGYQQVGTFTAIGASGAPDFSVAVMPGSQSVTGKGLSQYTATVTGNNGFKDIVNLSVTGLPPNSTLNPPANIGPGKATLFGINTTGATPAGAYVITITGVDGTLTHSATALLNVTAASIPTVSVSPTPPGSGTSQTFTFTATGQGGNTDPTEMNVLFNATLDGRNGCWIYFNGRPWLASDDGSIWAAGPTPGEPPIQNSQCRISSYSGADGTDTLGFNVAITFLGSFTGTKNIFVAARNSQGGDTGYRLLGTWTIP